MSQTEHSTNSIMATETLRQNSENIHQMSESTRHESDIDSDNFSENGEVCDLSAEKLDPADRELYEKLKQQEREEREEIEKELKAHEDALARHQEELRAREKELRIAQEIMVQREREMLSKHTEEYRAQLAHAHAQALSLSHMGRTPSPKNLKIDTHAVKPELQSHSPFSSQPSPDRFPPRVPSQSLSSGGSHSPPDPGSEGRAHHWTFEEQFKQLYELSDDPKRKEFLDDLFAYMQKRGTPVNRIPIMAKQTLDLYELFRLVVSKGGLVEVINKKLWREITKGLNLPSSITSAAFTLRTQYMKYLYPYECEKLKMSSPQELQAAIDGNRREGRRSSYGYDLSPGPTLVPASHHLNGTLINGKIGVGSPSKLWPHMDDHCEDDDSLPPTPIPHPAHLGNRGLTERDAIAMEVATRAMEEATRKMEAASRTPSVDEPPRKRMTTEEERLLAHAGLPSAHLKITSRNDGRSEIDNSLVVSMEINGIMYQGVLFAQHPRRM